jgi:hypothetical protein
MTFLQAIVQEALDKLMVSKEHMTIVIAHRLRMSKFWSMAWLASERQLNKRVCDSSFAALVRQENAFFDK